MALRSEYLTKGVETAPQRSLLYACGYTKEELERPLIGVVSAHSDIVPGHINLDKMTEAVKAGVRLFEKFFVVNHICFSCADCFKHFGKRSFLRQAVRLLWFRLSECATA